MEFKEGHIKRIRLKDFMNYDEIELFPKSGLNLIVGLNGTGKSSIMCAICLGLAGRPQFTGRSTQLCDFIKHGRYEAVIELELAKHSGKSVVILRSIKHNTSSWYINNAPSNQTQVLSVVRKFNIDTSNLCQFLPQEKVVEFSKMDKKHRLENMLQAIGEPSLFQLFNELKELRKKFCEVEEKIRQTEIEKAENEQKYSRLKPEIERLTEREKLKSHLMMLYDQRKILEYAKYQSQEKEEKRIKVQLEAKKNKISKDFEDMQHKRDKVVAENKQHQEFMKKLENSSSSLAAKLQRKLHILNELNAKVHNEKIEYKNRIAEKESQKKRLEELQQQVEGLAKAHAELKLEVQTYQEQWIQISQQTSELEMKHSSFFQQSEQLKVDCNKWSYEVTCCERRHAEMQNEEKKMMEKLRSISRQSYEATCWLLENAHDFKSNVYSPILLQIKVGGDENRKYIENAIPMRELLMFVCEDNEDAVHLTDILITQKKLRVNIAVAPAQPMSFFKSPIITNHDKNCGFKSFLSDLFSAPEPVMRYLCRCFNVHRIPICSTDAERFMEHFLTKFSLFYTPMLKISGRKSKYGQKCWSCMKDKILDKKLLATSENDNLRKLEERKIEEAKKNYNDCQTRYGLLATQLNDVEKCMEKNRQEKKALREKQEKFDGINAQLQQKEHLLQNIRKKFIDETTLKKRVIENIQNINNQRHQHLKDLKILLSEFLKLSKEKITSLIALRCFTKNADSVKQLVSSINDELQVAMVDFKKAEAAHRSTYEKAKQLLKEIQPILSGLTTKGYCSSQGIKKFLANTNGATGIFPSVPMEHMPADVDEVEQKIMHTKAQLNMNCEVDDSIVQEYNKIMHEMRVAQKKIDAYVEELKKYKNEIDVKKGRWLPPLESHIHHINKKFSQYFKFLNCAGEIVLDTCNDTDDFPKYGLQIRLQYREDEPFTELSQTHHSGGECSVAAIIFILSLQELTEVPFRCIDEINQGMDSVNERKIYQLVSDSASGENCSQYFLLTPKLLMDLTYPRNVAVHVIYNSCFMDVKLNVKKHLKQASKLTI